MDLSAAEIARRSGGRVLAGDPDQRFQAAALDSRRILPGALFVALAGARSDGHAFVAKACAAGAAGALVMRDDTDAPPGAVLIRVEDTTLALQALGAWWRDGLQGAVVGIAGSNGKTTTKEVLAAVLAQFGPTRATPGNANSQVSAPLALLDVPQATRFAVLELGTSAPGELTRLTTMARPDLCVITAAFAEHLEGLGSLAGVIAAECEILSGLRAGGRALIGSAEFGLVEAARRLRPADVRTLGERLDDAWQLGAIRLERSGTSFDLRGPDGVVRPWKLPLLGAPAAWAAAFAIAVAYELSLADGATDGGTEKAIALGLAGLTAPPHRLAPRPARGRPWLVLDDSYNSNPASCLAAVETALAIRRENERLVLVLGDMLELGAGESELHRETGREIARRLPQGTALIAVGRFAAELAAGCRDRGVLTREVADVEASQVALHEILADDVPALVLAKGSRGIALDRLAEALAGAETLGGAGA